ncbi:MAG TPA: hypothetical protein VJ208_00320 [Candidatus Nanoarchaeia archaeon]|nr:hypothetical protein [Candidatus Nanoarchaeia archaeon]
MNLEILALTFDFIGKILVVIMAILVHRKIGKERKIDRKVKREIYLEEVLGILGIILITAGYVLKLQIM